MTMASGRRDKGRREPRVEDAFVARVFARVTADAGTEFSFVDLRSLGALIPEGVVALRLEVVAFGMVQVVAVV